MPDTLKLYKVVLRGCRNPVGVDYHTSYTVAKNTDDAYLAVRSHLENGNLFFAEDRALHTIELMAEDCDFTETHTRLFLPKP